MISWSDHFEPLDHGIEIHIRRENVVLRGMSNGGPCIFSFKRMERLICHDMVERAAECLIMHSDSIEDKRHYHLDVQSLISKRSKVFGGIPPGRPPKRGIEHVIKLEEGAKSVITTPYQYPKRQKNETEKAIKELLDIGHIFPSKSPFASAVVLMKKKDGTMRMCVDYRALN